MMFIITEEQSKVLSDLFNEPLGLQIDIREIQFHEGNNIGVNINGRVLRYDTTDIDPDRTEIIESIRHVIDVITKRGESPIEHDPEARRLAREKSAEAIKREAQHREERRMRPEGSEIPPLPRAPERREGPLRPLPTEQPHGFMPNPSFNAAQPAGPGNMRWIPDPNATPPAGHMHNPAFDHNKPVGPGNRVFIPDPNAGQPRGIGPGRGQAQQRPQRRPDEQPPGFLPNPHFDASKPISAENRRFLPDPNAEPPRGLMRNPQYDKSKPVSDTNRRFTRDPNAPPPAGMIANPHFDKSKPPGPENRIFIPQPQA